MEPQPTPQTAPQPTPAVPQQQAAADAPQAVRVDPNEDTTPSAPAPQLEEKPTPTKPVKKDKAPRDSSVTLAIIATVIIVLGLAVIALLAFLQQK